MKRALQGALVGEPLRNHRGEPIELFGWLSRLGAVLGWRR